MATLLLGCAKGDNHIYRLDDPSLFEDEGDAYSAYFVTADVDFGPAGGEGRLRRICQVIHLFGDATMKVTPVADSGEVVDQAETHVLLASNGTEQRLEQYPASLANRHAIKVEYVTWQGPTECGECDLHLVPSQSRERVSA